MTIEVYNLGNGDTLTIDYEITLMDTKFHVGRQVIAACAAGNDGACRITHSQEEFPDLKQSVKHIRKLEIVFADLAKLSIKNGGSLTTEEINHYFAKMTFKDKLSGED